MRNKSLPLIQSAVGSLAVSSRQSAVLQSAVGQSAVGSLAVGSWTVGSQAVGIVTPSVAEGRHCHPERSRGAIPIN